MGKGAKDKQRAATACSKPELAFCLSNVTASTKVFSESRETHLLRAALRTGPHTGNSPRPGEAVLRSPAALGLGTARAAMGLPPGFSPHQREPLLTPSAQIAQSLGQGSASLSPHRPGTRPSHSTLAATGTRDTGKPRHLNSLCFRAVSGLQGQLHTCFRLLKAASIQNLVKNHNSTEVNFAFDFSRVQEHTLSLSLLQDSLGVNT